MKYAAMNGRPPIALQLTEPEIHPQSGEYVVDFDPRGADGRGILRTSPDLKNAKKFATVDEALAYYQQEAANGYQAITFFGVRLVEAL